MRIEPIKVGAKSKSARAQIQLKYRRPENVADCMSLCEGNEVAVAALFNRGYTIWLQDRFGRPMFEEGKPDKEIQTAFDTSVPGKTKGVSRGKATPVADLSAMKGKSLSAEDVAKLLAAQGFKVAVS